MKNAEYWAGRFKDLEEAEHRKGVKAVADIDQMYDRAIKDVESKIRVWYQRFADNNNITLAEAKKWLDKDALKELKWDIKEYIKYGKQNEVDQLWMKELENASAKVHISRLQALELQIRQSLEKVTADQLGETTGTMEDVYRTAYYHTAYEIDKGFGVGTDVGRIDQASIDRIINKPWAPDGKNFSDRIWENKNKLLSTIHQELTRGILTGVDPQKTIDAVAKKMNTSKHNAGRLVMTEEAYFSSLGQRDMFADLDVEKYEIVATLDSHTSEICQQMDGQVFKLSEYEAGVTAPPFHVYCRSTTAPWFDDDFGIPGERVARDEDGNREYVPADMTYKEWEKKFVKDEEESLTNDTDSGTMKVDRDYDSPLAKAYGKENYDLIRDAVDQCKNRTLAGLWGRYESEIDVRSTNYKKTAHCSCRSISLNLATDKVGSSYEKPFEVTFHESGHALDHVFHTIYEPRKPNHFSCQYENGKFPNMIREEINAHVDAKAAVIKQEFKDHAGDWKWLADKGYIDKYAYHTYEQYGRWYGGEPKYSKSLAYKAVEKEIRALNAYQRSDLSDMMEGATLAKIQAGCGHGKAYWSKGLGKDDRLATEAFAEMTSATMVNGESLETIKKYLPKSYAIYEEMLEYMAKQ